jgi:hypothetical protein
MLRRIKEISLATNGNWREETTDDAKGNVNANERMQKFSLLYGRRERIKSKV